MRWLGPIWSWPATFLFGKARATGIAAFNTLVRARCPAPHALMRSPCMEVLAAWRSSGQGASGQGLWLSSLVFQGG